MEEKLQAKTKELEELQSSFDDYISNSKELEQELEEALEEVTHFLFWDHLKSLPHLKFFNND
jgi:chaperonin cofactor prefoldin